MASVSRLTVWLKGPYQAFSIKDSLFFNWDSLVMHVDKPELLTIHKMSPRTHHILFVTKSLEPSDHFSTVISQTSQCSALPCLVRGFRFIMLQFPAWEITVHVLINHSFGSTNMSPKHYLKCYRPQK